MLRALIISMRPKQWTKNLLLFTGLIFSLNLSSWPMLRNASLGFIIFCLLSGALYILNDLRDLAWDRQHPFKSKRPLASGRLSPRVGWLAVLIFSSIGLVGSFFITREFAIITVSYYLLILLYSMVLKHIVIVDILTVSLGFVFRAVAGVAAIRIEGAQVELTPWFIACTLFLALFLVICKRRHELLLLEENASAHRRVLQEYSHGFIDQMVSVVTTATVISYAMWATIGYKHENMIYTLPFVLYGVFRYLYLTYHREEGGSPELLLINDRPLLINILLWLATVVGLLYAFPEVKF